MNYPHRFWSRRFRLSLKQTGFSLYDLLITSAVAGTVSVSAVGMTGLVHDARMTSEVNGLLAHLSLTRSEAIKRGYSVTLCKSKTGKECSKSSRWHDGWIIFVDKDRDWKVDTDEEIIRVQQALPRGVTLRYGEKGKYYHVTYSPTGYVFPDGTFSFCDKRESVGAKSIIVHWTGRPRSSTKDSDDKPIDCSKNAG